MNRFCIVYLFAKIMDLKLNQVICNTRLMIYEMYGKIRNAERSRLEEPDFLKENIRKWWVLHVWVMNE